MSFFKTSQKNGLKRAPDSLRLSVEALEERNLLAPVTFIVNTEDDIASGPGPGTRTLREAIQLANTAAAAGDQATIIFDPSVTTNRLGNAGDLSDLIINFDETLGGTIDIVGNGEPFTSITSPGGPSIVVLNGDVSFSDLTIENFFGQSPIVIDSGVAFDTNFVTFANNIEVADGVGGGIEVVGFLNNITIANSTFQINSADFGGAIALGGADNNLTITSSLLIDNDATFAGGGLHISGSNHFVEINTASDFSFNNANDGGAIHVNGNANQILSQGTTYFNNTAVFNGGAIYNDGSSNYSMANDSFQFNTASNNGGAVYSRNFIDFSFLFFGGTLFDSNQAVNGAGGAIFLDGGGFTDLQIDTSNFVNNRAFFDGGAIFAFEPSFVQIINTNFIGNISDFGSGGAIFVTGFSANPIILDFNSFDNNAALNGFGGAIHLDGDFTFNSSNSTYQFNDAFNDGGAISARGAVSLSSFNDGFSNNTAAFGGALFAEGPSSTVSLNQANFFSNFANDSGGAIKVHGANLTASNSVFDSNSAQFGAGAIYSFDTFIIDVIFSQFLGNQVTAFGDGGAIGIEGSVNTSLLIDQTAFDQNSTTGAGGAIAMNGSHTLNSSNTLYSQNTAQQTGGAIHLFGDNDLSSFSDLFQFNLANDGGAVFIDSFSGSSLIDFNDTDFNSNSATLGVGGAILMAGSPTSSLTVRNNSLFFSNTAAIDGGAIFTADVGFVNLQNSLYDSNRTFNGDGGAVLITDSTGTSSVSITNNQFVFNQADIGDGGAIKIDGFTNSVFLGGNNFDVNNAGNFGGALALDGPHFLTSEFNTFSQNTALDGGAVHSSGQTELRFTLTDTFQFNTASNNGGAVFVADTFGSSFLLFDSVTFESNQALNGSGGAIFAVGNPGTTLQTSNGTQFLSNTAAIDGGAIFAQDIGFVNVVATSFANNFVINGIGGAVAIVDGFGGSTNVIANSQFLSNRTDFGIGGAVGLLGPSSNTFFGGSIFDSNSANNGFGGAIFADGSHSISSEFSTYNANSAAEGGAIYLNGQNSFDSFDDDFTFNIALNNGGALYVNDPSGSSLVRFNTALIRDNQATGDGGAVYIAGNTGTFFEIIFSQFIRNIAGLSGGAIYALEVASILIETGNFDSNQATNGFGGAIFSRGFNTLNTIDSSAQYISNSAAGDGGAVYLEGNYTFNSQSSPFAGNSAGGLGGALFGFGQIDINSTSDGFLSNTASAGGAIFTAGPGNLNFVNATFDSNTATSGPGGAILSDSASSVVLNTSSFDSNSAVEGGGVFLSGDFDGDNTDTTLDVISTTFGLAGANLAQIRGGSIRTQGDVTVNLIDSTFNGNDGGQEDGGLSADRTDPINFTTVNYIGNNQFAANVSVVGLGLNATDVGPTSFIVDDFDNTGVPIFSGVNLVDTDTGITFNIYLTVPNSVTTGSPLGELITNPVGGNGLLTQTGPNTYEITGSLTEINTELQTLLFRPFDNQLPLLTQETFSISATVYDGSNELILAPRAITYNSTNPPIITTVPRGPFGFVEDSNSNFVSGVSIVDPNGNPTVTQVELFISVPTLPPGSQIFVDTTSTSGFVVTNDGTDLVRISGSIADVNDVFLNGGLRIVLPTDVNDVNTPPSGFHFVQFDTVDPLLVQVVDSDTLDFTISQVNDAPGISTASPYTMTNASVFLTGISFSDVDIALGEGDGTVTVVFNSVNGGVFDIDGFVPGGITFANITGQFTSTLTLTGLLSEINTTLASPTGLNYLSPLDFLGADTIQVEINDNGNAGAPGALNTQQDITVNIVNNVTPTMNDLPPLSPIVEGTQQDLFVAIGDPDSSFVSILVDWGDGTSDLITNVATRNEVAGALFSHVYLDDNPTGTPSDTYIITATVIDEFTGLQGETKQTTLTVLNSNPVITPIPVENVIDEGQFFSFSTNYSDLGADDLLVGSMENFTVTVDWGDGTIDTEASGITLTEIPGSFGVPTTGTISGTHAYADDGFYNVTITLMDDDGGSDSIEAGVLVLNVAPTLSVADQLATTAIPFQLAGGFTDPGFDYAPASTSEDFTVTVIWGDGDGTTDREVYVGGAGVGEVPGAAGILTTGTLPSHTYAAKGDYTVFIEVRDDDGGVDSATITVSVSTPNPNLGIFGAPAVNEGSTYTLNFSDTLPPGLPITQWSVDWGDGTGIQTIIGDPTSATHTYVDGLETVTISAQAIVDGTLFSANNTINVNVLNIAPVIALSGASSVPEGELYTLNLGNITDPGLDTVTQIIVDWGDGSSNSYLVTNPSGNNINATHIYGDEIPNNAITVTLIDEDGTYSTPFFMSVTNQAPVLGEPPEPITINEGENTGTLGITFTDDGFTDISTLFVNWGDGTPVQTISASTFIPGSAGGGTSGIDASGGFVFDHHYADGDNTYTVTLTANDGDGGTDIETFTVNVLNLNPVFTTVQQDITLNEGSSTGVLTVGYSDPGWFDQNVLAVDWGDGSAVQFYNDINFIPGSVGVGGAGTFNISHVYTNDGDFTVTMTTEDGDGGFDTKQFTATVLDVAPTLAGIVNASIPEGSVFSTNYSIVDPGDDTWSLWIDYYDENGSFIRTETISNTQTKTFNIAQFYADNGTGTVHIRVEDVNLTNYEHPNSPTKEEFISASNTASIGVNVFNVAPSIFNEFASSQQIQATGDTDVTISGQFTDPGADTYTLIVNWGDGSDAETVSLGTSKSFQLTHRYRGNPNGLDSNEAVPVSVTVRDDDGGEDNVILEATDFAVPLEIKRDFFDDEDQKLFPQIFNPYIPSRQIEQAIIQSTSARAGSGARGQSTDIKVTLFRVDGVKKKAVLIVKQFEEIDSVLESLPDGRYFITVIEEDGIDRFVMTFDIREGVIELVPVEYTPPSDTQNVQTEPETDKSASNHFEAIEFYKGFSFQLDEDLFNNSDFMSPSEVDLMLEQWIEAEALIASDSPTEHNPQAENLFDHSTQGIASAMGGVVLVQNLKKRGPQEKNIDRVMSTWSGKSPR